MRDTLKRFCLSLSNTAILSLAMIGHSNKTVIHRILTRKLSNGVTPIFPRFSMKTTGLQIVQTWTLWTILFGMNLCTRWTRTNSNQNKPGWTSLNGQWRKWEQQLSVKVATVVPTACIACKKTISTFYINKRIRFCRESNGHSDGKRIESIGLK